ncbi:hypothetical protein ACN2EN_05290 [Aliarcobacter lanthieri]
MEKPFLSNFESESYILNTLDDDSTILTESTETSDYDYSIIDIINLG